MAAELRFAERMTDLEAMMWRLEELDPALRPVMTVVCILEGELEPAVVLDRLDGVTRRVPRMRDRVEPGPLPMVPPRWVPDRDFDIGRHTCFMRLPGVPPPQEGSLAAAQSVAVESLDKEHPPWHMTFVGGLGGGRQGLIVRLHHSYTDGLGAVRLAGELFDATSDGPARDRPPLAATPWPPLLGRAVNDAAAETARGIALMRRIVPWAGRALGDALTRPGPRAQPFADVVSALWEQVRVAAAAGSPLLERRSSGLNLAAVQVPLTAMRESARSAGGTLNDVFVAVLLGALGRYHEKHGSVAAEVRLGVPMSTRTEDTGVEMRNQLAGALVLGPIRIDDPFERVKLVHERVRASRHQAHLGLLEDATALAIRIPGVVQVFAKLMRSLEVLASNVPGPPSDLFLAGSRVERMIPFGPRGGAALNATLLSYRDVAEIGLNLDPLSIPDVGVFADCITVGFDEIL